MKFIPNHIEDYCFVDREDSLYNELYKEYKDEYTFIYKVKCSCSETKFKVYKDRHPTISIQCSNCLKDIIVYDLKFYPAAVKLNKDFIKQQIILDDNEFFEVYVIYEYDDEFEIEDDVEFDPNDISWATVFIKSDKSYFKILDDETS